MSASLFWSTVVSYGSIIIVVSAFERSAKRWTVKRWSKPESVTFSDPFHRTLKSVNRNNFSCCGVSWRLREESRANTVSLYTLRCISSYKPQKVKVSVRTSRVTSDQVVIVLGVFDGISTLTMQVLERKGDPWEDVKGTYGTTCKVPSYLDRLLISQGGDIDFTLDDESTVKAHSLFLAERSPLIKKILQSQGCNKEPISVPFAKELFKDFLKFAYTNQIPPMKDSSAAEKVVLLAQHFECSSLMHAAELQLTSLVDQPNVVELCKFAVSNQCSLLLEECAAFITSHPYDRSWIVLKDDPVVRAALCNTVQSDIFEIVHKKPSADVWTTLEGACGSTCTDPFLWKLLQSDTGELTFISKDDFAIKAHSVIVMERSPHLKAILETSNTDQEPIPVPFDKAVFSKLLQYIYTNQIPAMDSVDDTKAVLKIADHFQCYGLKHAAEIRLVSTMDTEDVINLGIFAVSHSCPLLLEECGAAIVESFEDLRSSPSWTDLTREPKLMESLSDPTEPRVCEIYENLAAANKLCSLDGTKESLLKELEENKN